MLDWISLGHMAESSAFESAIAWLLEPDRVIPGVRYFALRELMDRDPDDPEVVAAREAVMTSGPVPKILAAQHPQGYWEKPGPGYSPKYRATVWQIIHLHDLGADGLDPRVAAGCEYVLEHTQAADGGFGCSGSAEIDRPPPGNVIHCLNGNLLRALIGLGRLEDARVRQAISWQARSVTGSDPGFLYDRKRTAGPGFACGVNGGLPCAWGAVKALEGLLAVPPDQRDEEVQRAIALGAGLLISRDPAVADYPFQNKISPHWFQLGFPSSYWSDVLENAELLTDLGYGADPRLDGAFELILGKRDAAGRWRLEAPLNGKLWAGFGSRGGQSKWVTLRALRTLRKAGRLDSAARLAS